MLKAVLFDMDGVLINSEPLHYKIWKKTLEQRGFDLDYEIYKPCIGSTAAFLMELLHEHYGIEKNDTTLMEEMKTIKARTVAATGFPLIKTVPAMLYRLKKAGLELAIASSSPAYYIHQVIKETKIAPYFTLSCSGEGVPNPKPAPDIFLKTAKELGCLPEECLVVEDSTNGSRAAQKAKMPCLGYYNSDSGEQDLSSATQVTSNFEEVNGIFLEKIYQQYYL